MKTQKSGDSKKSTRLGVILLAAILVVVGIGGAVIFLTTSPEPAQIPPTPAVRSKIPMQPATATAAAPTPDQAASPSGPQDEPAVPAPSASTDTAAVKSIPPPLPAPAQPQTAPAVKPAASLPAAAPTAPQAQPAGMPATAAASAQVPPQAAPDQAVKISPPTPPPAASPAQPAPGAPTTQPATSRKPDPVPPVDHSSREQSAACDTTLPFTVQTGAFLTRTYAQSSHLAFIGKGYPACILETTDSKNRRWYLVRIGAFETRQAAEAFLADFKEKEEIMAVVALSHSF